MSAGDKDDPFPVTVAHANTIIQFPLVARMMRRGYRIDSRNWDIPYLAGYSKNGDWIFIDRDLKQWAFGGKPVETNRFLILHEHIEKSIIDAIGMAFGEDMRALLALLKMSHPDDQIYFHCHGVAEAVEEYSVKIAYGVHGLDNYNAFMRGQIKRAEDERIQHVPRNLDMTPYQGHDHEDVRLRYVMEQHMQEDAR